MNTIYVTMCKFVFPAILAVRYETPTYTLKVKALLLRRGK
jgi:hypothetical protein